MSIKSIKALSLGLAGLAIVLGSPADLCAQNEQSSAGGVQRRSGGPRGRQEQTQDGTVVTQRMQAFYGTESDAGITDADRQWMRVIYRSIDLDKDKNAPLYFPEEPVDGQENLFRIIMKLLADNTIPAYEYLDGREIFTDQYRINTRDVLERFQIPFTQAKGSTERNPKFAIDENDVPTNEVLSYFVVERWEYDTRRNRLRPVVEAICPVLHRSGDFGGDALKYPMFWIKFSDIRPYLAAQTIFVDDDNNLPTCTYDDFFTLGMYDGEIYKTRNLKNRSMVQLYSDPDELKRAQDSIQGRLDHFEDKLWVPSREEILARREKAQAASSEEGDSTAVVSEDRGSSKRSTGRSQRKPSKRVKEKKPSSSPSSSPSNAARSVRRRK